MHCNWRGRDLCERRQLQLSLNNSLSNKLFNLAKSFEVCRIFCFFFCILHFSFALIKLNFLRDANFRNWRQTKMGNLKYIRRDPSLYTQLQIQIHMYTSVSVCRWGGMWKVLVPAYVCVCVSKKFLKAIYFSFHFGFGVLPAFFFFYFFLLLLLVLLSSWILFLLIWVSLSFHFARCQGRNKKKENYSNTKLSSLFHHYHHEHVPLFPVNVLLLPLALPISVPRCEPLQLWPSGTYIATFLRQ